MRVTYVPLDTMSESRQKKVIVIGDGAVGKTCFVTRATENKFVPNYLPTLGGELVTYTIPLVTAHLVNACPLTVF